MTSSAPTSCVSSSRLAAEGTAHGFRLALDEFDQRTRCAGWPARAELPFAHSADAGSNGRREFTLRQAELVTGQSRVGVARDDRVHNRAGFFAREVVARLQPTCANIVGQPRRRL